MAKDEAAAALSAYQTANNAVNAALDSAGEAKIEVGSLLTFDQASLRYALGMGGDAATAARTATTFANPVYYLVKSTTYPRQFFATVDASSPGSSQTVSVLLHFTQDHAAASWLVDTTVNLLAGRQWPAFAVGSDGLLDYSATKLDKVALSTLDLISGDKNMLADGNAGQPGSPFANDDVTAAEQKWITSQTASVAPAKTAVTLGTATNPLPTYLPLKDGGELVLFGTRISMAVSQPGHTFALDKGFTAIAGTDHFDSAFTMDAVYMTAAVDPPDKTAKIQKIAVNGGLMAVH